jgi:hypothetical protein
VRHPPKALAPSANVDRLGKNRDIFGRFEEIPRNFDKSHQTGNQLQVRGRRPLPQGIVRMEMKFSVARKKLFG